MGSEVAAELTGLVVAALNDIFMSLVYYFLS